MSHAIYITENFEKRYINYVTVQLILQMISDPLPSILCPESISQPLSGVCADFALTLGNGFECQALTIQQWTMIAMVDTTMGNSPCVLSLGLQMVLL